MNFEEFWKRNQKRLLNEKATKYGCLMLHFSLPEMEKIHSKIEEKDIYIEEDGSHGLEDEPHCTLLYGFVEDDLSPEQILDDVEKFDIPEKLELHDISLFKNEKYDVLKFDVNDSNKKLSDINRFLKDNYEYETDYPEYHPHCTIAYLKSGSGEKYVKIFKNIKLEAFPNKLIYSNGDYQYTGRNI